MKKVTKFPLILISLMLVTGLILYPELPAKIPTHWGASGKVDSWADKSLPVVFATPLASLGVYILFLLLPFILYYFSKKIRIVKFFGVIIFLRYHYIHA